MDRSAMPHEYVNADGINVLYDGLAECLLLMPDLNSCAPITDKGMGEEEKKKIGRACSKCISQAVGLGFTPEGWSAYRNWMKRKFPAEFEKEITQENINDSYQVFMAYMKERMPIFNRSSGRFEGFFNRNTKEIEDSPKEEFALDEEQKRWWDSLHEQPIVAAWVLKNCTFANKI